MKPIVPYAILGLVAVSAPAVPALLGSSGGQAEAPEATPAEDPLADGADGAVNVRAALDSTAQPTAGGEAFVRVALEGVETTKKRDVRVPVSLTLVIDRSGSMRGDKMDNAKRAAKDAIASLACDDSVSVVSFDNGAVDHGTAKVSCTKVARRGTEDLAAAIDGLFARGGTDMAAGLGVGGAAARRTFDAKGINRVLLLSDGQPDTEEGLRERVSSLATSGIQTTALGLGADYNADLMAALADAGHGRYHFVESSAQLAPILATELQSLSSIVAKEAVVELMPAPGVSIEEVVGFPAHQSGSRTVIAAGDIYGGKTTDILVRMRLAPSALGQRDVIGLLVSYTDAAKGPRVSQTRRLAALFTPDAAIVEQHRVADVAVKTEKWRAANAYTSANAAYDRGDAKSGDDILGAARLRLSTQSQALQSEELKKEMDSVDAYQRGNAAAPGMRKVFSKAAKSKAWVMNKGTAYTP